MQPAKKTSRSIWNTPLLLLAGGGSLVGAFYACRYAALVLFFFVCQPALLEEYATADPLQVEPANDGHLVYVRGVLSSADTIADPIYGVRAHGAGLWREVHATANALDQSAPPPEDHLKEWSNEGAPLHLGNYVLQSQQPDYPRSVQRVTHLYHLAEPMRDLAVIQPDGDLLLSSANGASYKVRFLTRQSNNFSFLGRQQGNTLVQDFSIKQRQDMIETQPYPHDFRYRLLRRVGLTLPLAWLLAFLGLWALRQVVARRLPIGGVMLMSAFALLSLLAWRLQQHIEAGALVKTNPWIRSWNTNIDLFDAERATLWSNTALTLAALSLAVALLLPLLIRRRTLLRPKSD